MSKESIRASIERKQGELARYRAEVAQLRAKKSETKERYAKLARSASSASSKASYRNSSNTQCATIDWQIQNRMRSIAGVQSNIASLRAQLKTAK